MTLPLSYSRTSPLRADVRQERPADLAAFTSRRRCLSCYLWLADLKFAPTVEASGGGEGRIRTFEAAGATDLQSVAFDRFATSP